MTIFLICNLFLLIHFLEIHFPPISIIFIVVILYNYPSNKQSNPNHYWILSFLYSLSILSPFSLSKIMPTFQPISNFPFLKFILSFNIPVFLFLFLIQLFPIPSFLFTPLQIPSTCVYEIFSFPLLFHLFFYYLIIICTFKAHFSS